MVFERHKSLTFIGIEGILYAIQSIANKQQLGVSDAKNGNHSFG